MPLKTLEKIRISLPKDTLSNWQIMNPTILEGELVIVDDNDTEKISKLIIGNNAEFNTLNNEANAEYCFYPGIGAGYVLPTASVNKLGGIQINADYFTMNENTLEPVMLRYAENAALTLTTPEGTSLNIPQTITCDKLIANNINYETWVGVSDLFVDGKYISINAKTDGTANPPTLENNEYSGILFYNYKNDGETQDERSKAELSINNQGQLFYSLGQDSLKKQILMMRSDTILSSDSSSYLSVQKDENGFLQLSTSTYIPATNVSGFGELTLIINGNPHSYSPVSSSAISFDIPTDYCNSIVVEGNTYTAVNNVITVGSLGFTNENAATLNSAVQTITYNGTTYSGPEIAITSKVQGSEAIEVKEEGGVSTILHYDPGYVDIVGEQVFNVGYEDSSEFPYIITVNRDKLGHVPSYSRGKLSFTKLLQRIDTLEESGISGEEYQNLLQRLNMLENADTNLTLELNNAIDRIAALEAEIGRMRALLDITNEETE